MLLLSHRPGRHAAGPAHGAFLIVYFLMRAVEHGQASVVIPIANMSFLVALAISLLTRLESLTARKALAVVVAVGAIVLLSRA